MSHASRFIFVILCLLILAPFHPARAKDGDGLPDYYGESSWLLSPPGMAPGLAAGLFNPAAYGVAESNGLYLGWRGNDALSMRRGDLDFTTTSDDFAGVVSLRNLSFSVQHFDFDPDAFDAQLGPGAVGDDPSVTDYSLSIGGGNRDGGIGLSYSWAGGDRDLMPRHKRMTLGLIGRRPVYSLGVGGFWDLENGDTMAEIDLGVRPFGPRITVFGDFAATQGRKAQAGYGVEAQVLAGFRVSARYRDGGYWGLGVGLSFGGGARLSVLGQGDGDQNSQNVIAFQSGGHRDPSLGAGRRPASGGGVSELDLKGPMPYRTYEYFDGRRPLLPTLATLAAWSEDHRVRGVLVNLSGMRITREMLWELREQFAGLQASGKRVTVYADRLGLYQLMLASVADEIWLDPQGSLEIRGLRWGRTYYRAAMDKLGLGVDEWRFFTYKSAFEALSRTSQSEADREQRQALVDDFYETVRDLVCEGREIAPAEFDRIVDEIGYVTPAEALDLGLVDAVGTLEEARVAARKAPAAPTVAATGPELGGVLGDPVWAREVWGEPDRIAVLYAIGACAMDTGIQGRRLSEEIRKARKDPRVKAVVLRADSPGGDPLPSDLVARELRETMKVKPVVVSQGNVAASGGYWISMYSNALVASPFTLTGSIGVIGGWIYDDGFSDKIGFDYSEVHRGAHGDLGGGVRLPFTGSLPARPMEEDERQRVEEVIRDMYDQFVRGVAEGRGMSEEAVDAVGQGRVWSGTAGLGNGLVDELGGLWRAIQLAKEKAGIPYDEAVKLVQGPSLGPFNFAFLQPKLMPGMSSPSLLDPLGGGPQELLGPWMGLSEEELQYLKDVFGNPGAPVLRMAPAEILDSSGGR